jgi:SNF2 family DNA or RNA helicase
VNVLEQREGKAIIWCRFNEDIRRVMKKLGDKTVDYYGETSPKARQQNLDLFLNANSSVRYLVASPEAAGTGLNLQGICRTNVYYSNSFNSLARWQSEGRTWRDGTTGSVVYIDLVAKGSPDSRILQNLKDKKSISDLALDEYRKLIAMEDNDEIF